MSGLLERSIEVIDRRLVLLAPPTASVPRFFTKVSNNASSHQRLVREMQQLRGSVYYRDGAVQRHELSDEGLHQTSEDSKSWHLLMLDNNNHVDACIWYLEHENTTSLQNLRVKNSPLATSAESRDTLQLAVRSELVRARQENVRYSEVGGWAVSEQRRCTPEGLLLILGTFSLSRALGGALGLATATARHSSAAILRRLGLSPLEVGGTEVSEYFDPKYNCDMELLRYDTRRSSPRYEHLIERLKARLANVTVVKEQPSVIQVETAAA